MHRGNRRTVVTLACCALLLWPVIAAGKGPHPAAVELEVVELFTSQGCSSCPPADALLSKLAEEYDVLALSFHVDYWNRLGWVDPFSSPQWSQRQRAYARRLASDSVYTPQMVVDGRYEFVGSDEREARRVLSEVRQSSKRVTVDLRAETVDGTVRVRAASSDGALVDVPPSDLLLLISESSLSTDVPRGENRNRTLRHTNVVRALERREWTGEAVEWSIDVDPSWGPELEAVTLIQARRSLAILGAARTRVQLAVQ